MQRAVKLLFIAHYVRLCVRWLRHKDRVTHSKSVFFNVLYVDNVWTYYRMCYGLIS